MSTSEQLQQLLGQFKKEQLRDIETAAEAGDAQAQFKLGALYANGRGVKTDYQQAFTWLERSAEQGYYAAQTLLAWLYAGGHGVAGSLTEARNWYARAAASGDPDAQCALGDLHYNGASGLERDPRAMIQWYERAAQQGHPKAQYMLGKLLAEGQLVEENDEAAFQWLTLAVLNESEPAQKELQMLSARLGPLKVEEFKQRMMDNAARSH